PMLATLASSVTDSDDWIFEQKLDGFRSIAHVSHKAVLLRSRNDKDFNQQFPSIVKDLQKTDRTVILDGEIVAEDAKGKTRFQLLQNGEPLPARYKLYYYVFDMLMLDDNDLRDFPLIERKDLLKRWLQRLDMPSIRLLEIVGTSEKDALEVAKENDWEGVMAKQTDSRYGSGKRSDSWRKLKLQQSQEAIIVGFTAPSGSRIAFGTVVLPVL
ncbi:DNA ligase, partial [Brucella sp. 21LCYQ03]|nr:DNA ligase [Brucella sp. 21LCYQ03]